MGDVPAGHISKGVIHAAIDKLVNHKDLQGLVRPARADYRLKEFVNYAVGP